ncbi:MAG: hypothetical protein Kow00121_30530 [Elainellaceae cyanobacterium]
MNSLTLTRAVDELHNAASDPSVWFTDTPLEAFLAAIEAFGWQYEVAERFDGGCDMTA